MAVFLRKPALMLGECMLLYTASLKTTNPSAGCPSSRVLCIYLMKEHYPQNTRHQNRDS